MTKYVRDLAERIAFTAAEAGVAYAIVQVSDLKQWWVLPLTTVLAAAKGWLAKHVGSSDTAGFGS